MTDFEEIKQSTTNSMIAAMKRTLDSHNIDIDDQLVGDIRKSINDILNNFLSEVDFVEEDKSK